MTRCTTSLVTSCLLLLAASTLHAATVKNISTGIDASTGLPLPNDTPDTNYVIAPGGTGGFIGQNPIAIVSPLPGTYMPDSVSTASRWVAVNSNSGLEGISVPVGTFEYQTTVNLAGFDPATAVISSARFGVDDALDFIMVNGTTVFTPPAGFQQGFDQFYSLPASLGAGAFVNGVNTITFEIANQVPGTPEAFRLEASVTATAPEPATLIALTCALPLLSLRRNKKPPAGI